MHFLLSTMSVVYILNTPIRDDGDDAIVEQIRRRNKWENDDYDSLKYMAEDASSKKFLVSCIINKLSPSWKDFKHALKHNKDELTLVELGSHLRIEKSLRGADRTRQRKTIVVVLSCNMVGLTISTRTDKGGEYMDTMYFQGSCQTPDPKLKTLGEKDIECIFVGYAEHSKAFRFYVIKPNESVLVNSIIKSRDAIFDENRFSLIPSLSQRSLINRTEYIGGLVVPEEITKEVVDQQPEPDLRKSKRNRTPKNFGPEFQLYLIKGARDEVSDQHSYCFNVEDDPKIFDEAIKKLKVDGTIEKFKARLVIQSFRQKSGIDYFDTYDPVTRISTIRLLIALASSHNLIIRQMDVKTAFLNGELDEKEPKQWHQKFDEVFLSNGYLLNQADKCVYSKFDKSGKGVIFCLYVDDMLIFGTDQVQAVSQLEYSKVIDCLMYVMTCTRHDIAFAVGKLSSWISNTEDNSSTSGWVFLLDGGAISWASKKQTCISSSTMESEFVALAVAGKEAEYLAILAKAYSQMYNGKSRHLGVRHNMIRELIMNGVVSIEFVRSQQNLAGHLTKGLARDLVLKSAEGMGLKSNLWLVDAHVHQGVTHQKGESFSELSHQRVILISNDLISGGLTYSYTVLASSGLSVCTLTAVCPIRQQFVRKSVTAVYHIQCADSDTRPPMLDRFDFESWQHRIHLYYLGKDNGENIIKLIDEGPFKMGKFRETLAEGAEGALHLGPERDRVFADLTPEEKERFKADIRATNILLQVKLNRGLKTSNYDQLYAYLKQHEAHANENKMMLERYTQHAIDPLALVSNVSPHQYPSQSSANPQSAYVPPVNYQPQFADNTQPDSVAARNGGVQNRVGNANHGQVGQAKPIKCYNCNGIGHITRQCTHPKRSQNSKYFKDKMLMQAQENRVVLDEEQLLFIAGGQTNMFDDDVDEAPVQDLALNEDNVFQADLCDALDSDVDAAPTA
ncbi:zinc finger, CCHC-type containing protein [Tanacetum coccineum]